MTHKQMMHKLGEHDGQLLSLRRDIENIKSLTAQIHELTATMKVLADNIEKQNNSIRRFGERIETLETAPNSRLREKIDHITKYMIIAVLTALITYFFANIRI